MLRHHFAINSIFFIIVCLICVFLTFGFAGANPIYPALEDRIDISLQNNLEHQLRKLDLDGAVEQKNLSVALVDITDLENPRLAMVNGDHMMYAASLPKIAILLGAFDRIANGEMELDHETRSALEQMIRHSSNTAATEMLERVDPAYLSELLQSPAYRLYAPEHNGGLWVGKPYGKNPAWKRDPIHQISHGATALQVARFYYMLETGRLVSSESCREMKQILSRPAIPHKFVKGLDQSCPEARIYRKSGTWREYHADSALIEHRGHTYIAVALSCDPNGSRWLTQLIVALDDIICH
jgi:beta-lactamase class A